MTPLKKIMMSGSILSPIGRLPDIPVRVEYADAPKPAPDPKKRAKAKAARKQRKAKQ
jgi:hypothetical protein